MGIAVATRRQAGGGIVTGPDQIVTSGFGGRILLDARLNVVTFLFEIVADIANGALDRGR